MLNQEAIKVRQEREEAEPRWKKKVKQDEYITFDEKFNPVLNMLTAAMEEIKVKRPPIEKLRQDKVDTIKDLKSKIFDIEKEIKKASVCNISYSRWIDSTFETNFYKEKIINYDSQLYLELLNQYHDA